MEGLQQHLALQAARAWDAWSLAVDRFQWGKERFQERYPSLDADQLLAATIVCLGFFFLELSLRVGPLGRKIRAFSEAFREGKETSRDRSNRIRNGIVVRLIATVHNCAAVPMALYCLQDPALQADRMKAHTLWSTRAVTFTCGYFMHDLLTCLLDFGTWGAGYLLHALACFTVYFLGSNQYKLHYYGACFLMWEISTPFVHFRWLLKSIGKDTTILYTVNGLLMMSIFFCCRNVFGVLASYMFWIDSGKELVAEEPTFRPEFLWSFRVCNLLLNLLNLYWFNKMLLGALSHLIRRPRKHKTE